MTETMTNELPSQAVIKLLNNDSAIALVGTQEENLKIIAGAPIKVFLYR